MTNWDRKQINKLLAKYQTQSEANLMPRNC